MSDFRYILGDTETTGPTPSDRVVEIAWVELDEDLTVLDRQHSLIDPEMPISPQASGVHGITAADVIGAPTMDEFFDIILGSKIEGPVMLIAHNVAFDKRYFAPYIPDLAGELCTLRLARRLIPEAPDHKLQTLKYFLNLRKEASHSAAGDVEMTLDLLRILVDRSGKTLPELAAESMQPVLVEVMPFGKHKGLPLRDVPRAYFKWLLGQGNLDRDLQYSIEMLGR